MAQQESSRLPESVNIRPGVRILSVLRHLNYKPWFALAEFVDNSLQSFLDYRRAIAEVDGSNARLQVDVRVDVSERGRIVVRDNAAGIHWADFPRAFRPAEQPPDSAGLCEFGMGMKSAACWFAKRWTVRTAALGEREERTVAFDIDDIVADNIENIEVRRRSVDPTTHFTEIVLVDLHNIPYGRTIGKIREHLASIYRVFIREGILDLRFNGEPLAYEEPSVLVAPYYRALDSPAVEWRKDISFDLGGGQTVRGFAAIRQVASTRAAGFALFRRRRLIEGSGDETYRPEQIFGTSNTYVYQRVFGELHLEGFEISHTKDGFRWDQDEEPFLDLLKEHLNAEPLRLLDQAEGHRARPRPEEVANSAEIALAHTADAIETEVPQVLARLQAETPAADPPVALAAVQQPTRRVIDVELDGDPWRIILELTTDPSVGEWVELANELVPDAGQAEDRKTVGVRMSLVHPFMVTFAGNDAQKIEPLLRIAAGTGLAETAARLSGVRLAGTVRRNLNELLTALSSARL